MWLHQFSHLNLCTFDGHNAVKTSVKLLFAPDFKVF